MPQSWSMIPPDIQSWILKQPLFFTASAPTHGRHVNVSPKGYPCRSFAILSPTQVAYLDATGSGCETIAHAYENGRVTVMFCSFTKFCRILRLFCRARVIERASLEFKPFIEKMKEAGMRVEGPDPKLVGKLGEELGGEAGRDSRHEVNFDVKREGNGVLAARAIIVLDVWKCTHSCGYGVPLLAGGVHAGDEEEEGIEVSGPNVRTEKLDKRSDDVNNTSSVRFDDVWDDRNTMNQYGIGMIKKAGLRDYRVKWNAASLDNVPGLEMAMKDAGRDPKTMRLEHLARRVFREERLTLVVGVVLGLFLAVLLQRVNKLATLAMVQAYS